MKIFLSLLLGCSLLLPQLAAAHGDHDHHEPRVISEAVAITVAQRATTSMTRKDAGLGFGQLSEGWSSLPKDKLAIHKNGYGYYVVSVHNDDEQQTLYVLMSSEGEVYDANMSGEFDGID